jgi:hypothetical protein
MVRCTRAVEASRKIAMPMLHVMSTATRLLRFRDAARRNFSAREAPSFVNHETGGDDAVISDATQITRK